MSTLGDHQGNGIRFDMHLSAPNGGVAQMLRRPEGQWVSWNEYEKMKAEVERLRTAGDELAEAGSLAGCSECFGLYERLEDALKAWTAAKEGKLSV